MKRLINYETFLFDLDGTLLELSFEEFTEEYYKLLVETVSPKLKPEVFLTALNNGVYAMLKNSGFKTNEEVFYEEFEKVAGPVDDELREIFDRFYREEFKKLSHHGRPRKEAVELIYKLRSYNKKLVLATNPVFPFQAIKERLSWANLKPELFDFITTFEKMKACKPSRAYFLQILEEIQSEPDKSVMIGDDPELDMGALSAGIDLILIGKEIPYEDSGRVRVVSNFSELLNLF